METKEVVIEQYKTNIGNFVKVKGAYASNPFNSYLLNELNANEVQVFNGYAKLDQEVTSVKQLFPARYEVEHFILKDPELESVKLPLVVDSTYDDEEMEYVADNAGYEAMYRPVYKESPAIELSVPFSVVTLGEYVVDNPTNLKDRKIRLSKEQYTRGEVRDVELSSAVVYEDIVKLLTPEFLLHEAPCKLTSHQMYKIVRQYLLENLDMKENIITSNYDFCFTVKKRVHTKPFIVNESYIAGRNKWKTKSVTKNEKQVEVFEMTYSGYKGKNGYEGYTCIPELHGDNLEDLYNKLESFLTNLIEKLNTRVKECECCNGTGNIVVKP